MLQIQKCQIFYFFLIQSGGQELTEEEVAKLDLELELELDNVNAENID